MIKNSISAAIGAVLIGTATFHSSGVLAQPLPGGTLDPTTIPKFVTPLVIPPEMPTARFSILLIGPSSKG